MQGMPDSASPTAGCAEWLAHHGRALPAAVRDSLPEVWAASAFVARLLQSGSVRLDAALCADLQRGYGRAEWRRAADTGLRAVGDEDALARALRRWRNREMLRIAWRELAGWAPLEETLADTSRLAEACLEGALACMETWHAERHGRLPGGQRLVVLGMGKLGAGELNFSSDIDLIFAFPGGGESDGPRPLAAEEYFTRLGRRLIQVLDARTADGFVFRVDMRLRPFGDSGPLAMSFDAMEQYYQQHGREWERYAFIKAAPVAGDREAGRELLEMLRPFVYRRYLDYGVFESLRDMKQRIMAEVQRRELEDNIKLGAGGIREIEFVGQVFQLIRGGREPRFRRREILPVLHLLEAEGLLGAGDAAALREAYVFLRRVENRLQMWDDRQTHDLPAEPAGRARLARSLGFTDWAACAAALERHRARVHAIFNDVVVVPRQQVRESESELLARAWSGSDEADELLRAGGYARPEAVRPVLERLRQAGRPLGERGRRRLDELVPAALRAAAGTEAPELTFARLAEVLEAVMRRSSYLALLLENRSALAHLTRLCAASKYLTDLVARHPLLLDELIDPRIFQHPPDLARYGRDLEALFRRVEADDLERQMDALREFQQTAVMRVAAADIAGTLPLMRVSDHLTAIAEQIIARALSLSRQHLVARHGEPRCREGGRDRPADFVVVAYGKLGGIELGYGSDLDLVFLHDSAGEAQHTDGARPLENSVFFMRLTQRLIHLLSTPTAAGVLYEVDTRLRPSGTAGLLVTSLDAFRRYHQEAAWTWEQQALLRARPVAGDIALGERFWALRAELLCRPREPARLAADVLAMRERMRRELGREAGTAFDVKQDPGGLTDLEFLVQYLVLRHAREYPDLVEYPDVIRFIDGLEIHGLLPAADCRALVDAYRDYRAHLHHRSLRDAEFPPPQEFAAHRERVRVLWRRLLDP